MKLDIDITVFEGTDPVLTIVEEVFASMIDDAPDALQRWDGPVPELVDPIHAWVDVHGTPAGRVLLSTERPTAEHLTRSLLAMAPDEPVADADIVDALGEVANVVGGNVKALVPEPGRLGLPVVAHERPATDPDNLVYELALDWRARILVIGLWSA